MDSQRGNRLMEQIREWRRHVDTQNQNREPECYQRRNGP